MPIARFQEENMTEGTNVGRRRLRILMLGPVNHMHVQHMAVGVRDQGHEVIVGGETWAGVGDSRLPDGGIRVSERTWPTARWLRRLMRETEPDVVHAHWLPTAALALAYGAHPLVAHAWGSDVFLAARRQRLAYRVLLRHADLVMADSTPLANALQRLGAPPVRVALINWGIDLQQFSPTASERAETRRTLGLPPGPVILSPRSLRELYNPLVILRAFERVAARHSDVTLVLKHMGDDAPDLGRMRFPDRVRIIGHVPYEQMADYYRAADVCVSIATSDSSPRSVWEAMGCGAPCVVSDLPWVHELIRDEQHALVVPIDETSVADGMERLLIDRDLSTRIAREARRLVEAHRNSEAEFRRICALYERVADGPAGTGAVVRQAVGAAAATVGMAQALARRRAA
jgi:glycosyltransferase involved in cell wall biosynthesis